MLQATPVTSAHGGNSGGLLSFTTPASASLGAGTSFTSFTGTKVQILTAGAGGIASR